MGRLGTCEKLFYCDLAAISSDIVNARLSAKSSQLVPIALSDQVSFLFSFIYGDVNAAGA